MPLQFGRHYTVEEARALLPQVRRWLQQLTQLRRQFQECESHLSGPLSAGADCGGERVNRLARTTVDLRSILQEFERREIQIKDLDRGLVDFPAVLSGKEVFLCWEQDEQDIEFWHDLDAGYAGRERLEPGT
jgi:hypothetical protein